MLELKLGRKLVPKVQANKLKRKRHNRKLVQSSHRAMLLRRPLRSQATAHQSNNKRYPAEVTQLPNRKCKSRDPRFNKRRVRLNPKQLLRMKAAFLEAVLKLVKGQW